MVLWMLGWLKKLVVENPFRLISIFVFIVYITGFVIWNRYLSVFGFFEYNLIQVRYLSAGLLFWILCLVILGLVTTLYGAWMRRYPAFQRISKSWKWTFFFFWIIPYFLFVFDLAFQEIPQFLGGAKPIATSIIGNGEQIEYLGNFGIASFSNGNNKSVQTTPICIFYQNDEYVVLGYSELRRSGPNITVPPGGVRVLSLNRSQFFGFHTSQSPVNSFHCRTVLAILGPSNFLRRLVVKNVPVSDEARQLLCAPSR